ncbi:hypothetical protein [Streptomyces sp. NPDC051704]|uniref:hypothetical protein n=1 Tax=Streptomyces sp. NPDC051704 TaxID=3365671 RepID=UPI0037AECEF3
MKKPTSGSTEWPSSSGKTPASMPVAMTVTTVKPVRPSAPSWAWALGSIRLTETARAAGP